LAETNKNQKPSFGLSPKKTQVSAQSSLGELGSSLLRFLQPAVRVKAHVTQHDYMDEAKASSDFVAANFAAMEGAAAAGSKIVKVGIAKNVAPKPTKPAPGQAGSGVISVNRDPSTPWVQVLTGLIDSCQQSKVATQSALGAKQYQASAENRGSARRKTVGRIINIMSEEDEPLEAVEAKPVDTKVVPPVASEKKKAA
jgi:hypothetical protein